MADLKSLVHDREDALLDELKALLRIPSVSTDPARASDVARCAAWVHERAANAGFRVETIATDGHPVVLGELLVDPSRPTVLIYGHYDVQPPDPLDLWRHGPFEPTVEGEYLVARGSTDDKGQFYALLKGTELARELAGSLSVNVKILIEGEEEVGSPNLVPFIRSHADRLTCDVVVIADSCQFARDVPAITYGLKGLAYLEIVVRGAATDLHSGSFGGAVANPANVLTRLIAACQCPFGRVAIPGFYDDVKPIEDWERKEFAKLPFDDEQFRQSIGAPELFGEEGYSTLERRWARPTLDVNGLLSGFTGEGAKTVLPCEARAKFSMRLVPDQTPERITELVREFLNEIAPSTVELDIIDHHGAHPVLLPTEGRFVDAAMRAYEHGFGCRPVFIREGGSIPVVNTFREELGADSLLLGLGLPDDGAHAPNERFRIEDYYRGIVTMGRFLAEI